MSLPPASASAADSGSASNVRRIKRIEPVQFGKVMAICYGLVSLVICVPMALVGTMAGHLSHQNSGALGMFSGIFFLFMPVLYAVFGGLFAALSAFVYNLIAEWIGGIEIEIA